MLQLCISFSLKWCQHENTQARLTTSTTFRKRERENVIMDKAAMDDKEEWDNQKNPILRSKLRSNFRLSNGDRTDGARKKRDSQREQQDSPLTNLPIHNMALKPTPTSEKRKKGNTPSSNSRSQRPALLIPIEKELKTAAIRKLQFTGASPPVDPNAKKDSSMDEKIDAPGAGQGQPLSLGKEDNTEASQ